MNFLFMFFISFFSSFLLISISSPLFYLSLYQFLHIVAYGPVAGQRPRDKYATASQTSMFARQQLETATVERCFLCGPCRDVSSKAVTESELVSWVESRQLEQWVVRQSPAGKNVSTEAKVIVRIRHQATTGEGSQQRRFYMCCGCTVYELYKWRQHEVSDSSVAQKCLGHGLYDNIVWAAGAF
jgi:hypothetical protein